MSRLVFSLVLYGHSYLDIKPLLSSILRLPDLNHLFTQGVSLHIRDNSQSADAKSHFLNSLSSDFQSLDIFYHHDSLNLGFGSGHNYNSRKARLSSSDLFCIVNPDIYFESDELLRFLSWFVHSSSVCSSPLIVNNNDSIQFSCKRNPTFLSLLLGRFAFLRRANIFSSYYSKANNSFYSYDLSLLPSSYLSGCFLAVKGYAYLMVNGLIRFFLHLEDADLLEASIGLVLHYPFSRITHLWARGSHKSLFQMFCLIRSYCYYF